MTGLRTAACDLLGIRYPIVQTGMGWVSTPELTAATANAGGLGILTALTQPSPDALRGEIEREVRIIFERTLGKQQRRRPVRG